MSIIEKALDKLGDKLGDTFGTKAAPPPAQAVAADSGLVEQAVQRRAPRAPEAPAIRRPPPVEAAPISRQIALDFDKLRARGLLTSDDERSQMAEEYRMIKRPILANAFGAWLTPMWPSRAFPNI